MPRATLMMLFYAGSLASMACACGRTGSGGLAAEAKDAAPQGAATPSLPTSSASGREARQERDTRAPAEAGAMATEGGATAALASVPLSREEVLAAANRDVDAARALAPEGQASPDCDKIVDRLDVSFGIALPKMSDNDKSTLAAFAACAKKRERWRLLEEVTMAMNGGDPAFASTEYLPRALVGLGRYDAAAKLAASILNAWPKEGDVYNGAALASLRLEDWENAIKQADQALLIQRQKGLSDEVTATAHVLKGVALAHKGKLTESNYDLDLAAKIQPEPATTLRQRNDVTKQTGLILEADVANEVYLGLSAVYPKAPPPLGPVAELRLYDVGEKAVDVRVEIELAQTSDPVGKVLHVVKGAPERFKVSPPFRADFKAASVIAPSPATVHYKVTLEPAGTVLFEDTRRVTLEPIDRLPTFVSAHTSDRRPAHELAAAWVTPSAPAVVAVLDDAKKRAPAGTFAGNKGLSLPQVSAICDELRTRGVRYVRDPSVDSEAAPPKATRRPSLVLASGQGNAVEGSLVLASLLEAAGLSPLLVWAPGHMFVGWLPTEADHASADAMGSTVASRLGNAFFLETTGLGGGPADAAILVGDTELVETASGGAFDNGSATELSLTALRKAGIIPGPSDG